MRFVLASLLSVMALLAGTLPASSAALHPVTLLGAMDFLGTNDGWIEMSSSAAYTLTCQTSLHPPASCNRAATAFFATTDGGRTWSRRLRLTGAPLIPYGNLPQAWLHLFDPHTILTMPFVSSPNGNARLYRTIDGGRSWTSASIPRSMGTVGPTDVTFTDSDHLWLLRHDGAAMGSEQVTVFATADGGARWSQIACTALPVAGTGCRTPSGLQLAGHKDNIVFGSASHGWITESDASGIPSLYVTRNGGYHWRLTRPGLPAGVPAATTKAKTYPYAEYQRPIVFGSFVILPVFVTICTSGKSSRCRNSLYARLSFDGGQTWTASRRIPGPNTSSSSPWQVMTAGTWWSVAGSHLWTTDDAGVHWRSIPLHLPGRLTLLQIDFLSRSMGWAIAGRVNLDDSYAQTVRLLRTTDGGRTWMAVHLPALASS